MLWQKKIPAHGSIRDAAGTAQVWSFLCCQFLCPDRSVGFVALQYHNFGSCDACNHWQSCIFDDMVCARAWNTNAPGVAVRHHRYLFGILWISHCFLCHGSGQRSNWSLPGMYDGEYTMLRTYLISNSYPYIDDSLQPFVYITGAIRASRAQRGSRRGVYKAHATRCQAVSSKAIKSC